MCWSPAQIEKNAKLRQWSDSFPYKQREVCLICGLHMNTSSCHSSVCCDCVRVLWVGQERKPVQHALAEAPNGVWCVAARPRAKRFYKMRLEAQSCQVAHDPENICSVSAKDNLRRVVEDFSRAPSQQLSVVDLQNTFLCFLALANAEAATTKEQANDRERD